MTLKKMYHCVPSNMSTMLPQPSGMPARCSTAITSGNSMGAGNEATTWTTGCRMRDSRGDRPIASPAGSAHSVPARVAAVTRPSVSAPRREELGATSASVTSRKRRTSL